MKKLLASVLLFIGLGTVSAQTTASSTVAKQKEKKIEKKAETAVKAKAAPVGVKLKKDGTPDKRYKEAKRLKKDGTPDMRYKANKK